MFIKIGKLRIKLSSIGEFREGGKVTLNDKYYIEIKISGKNRPKIEVSGGIKIKDIRKFLGLDIDFVSSGYITHSAPSIDFSLEIFTSA